MSWARVALGVIAAIAVTAVAEALGRVIGAAVGEPVIGAAAGLVAGVALSAWVAWSKRGWFLRPGAR